VKFNDRLFLSIAMLAQNPVAFGLALVLVPILLVFAAYVVFEIGMYIALPALAVVLVLKLANGLLKPKHRYVQPPLVRRPQTPELPPVSQPLLKGPQRW
jgi:hypothetical protein